MRKIVVFLFIVVVSVSAVHAQNQTRTDEKREPVKISKFYESCVHPLGQERGGNRHGVCGHRREGRLPCLCRRCDYNNPLAEAPQHT